MTGVCQYDTAAIRAMSSQLRKAAGVLDYPSPGADSDRVTDAVGPGRLADVITRFDRLWETGRTELVGGLYAHADTAEQCAQWYEQYDQSHVANLRPGSVSLAGSECGPPAPVVEGATDCVVDEVTR